MDRNSLEYTVDLAVAGIFYDEFFVGASLIPDLFTVSQSDGASETLASVGGGGEWQAKAESADPIPDEMTQQFKKTFTHTAYASSMALSRELIEDNRWGILENAGMQLSAGALLRMEKDAASLFNDAFAGAIFKSEDNKSLCNTAHVNSDGGNSQSNSLTNTLDFDGIRATRLAFKKLKNYRGELIGEVPDELLIPDDLEEDGWALVNSMGKTGTANNDANFYQGRFKMFVNSRLTDTNAWFMMSSRQRRRFLRWYQRVAPEVFGEGDLFRGGRKIGGYMRYSLGCTHWAWIVGNNA